MRKKLSDLVIRTAKAPERGRLELWDAILPGFGLRVTARDARTYFLMYRTGAGERRIQRRMTIGNARAISLAEARHLAREALEKVGSGIDPSAGKPAVVGAPPGGSFAAVADLYLDRYVSKNTRPSTAKETRRILDVDVLPVWGTRPIDGIGRRDVAELLDGIATGRRRPGEARRKSERGAETQANRTLARLRALFNWAVENDHLAASPIAHMKPRTKERARDRYLTDAEIRWFWKACDTLGWPFGPLFQLLLVTAQRRDEVGSMEWPEIDLPGRLWTIPREKAKNDRTHEVALSDLAREILAGLPQIHGPMPAGAAPQFVFTTILDRPVSGFSKAKLRLDELMNAARREDLGLPDAAPGMEDWILHDLRRTAATGMAKMNVPPHVVDRILNHTSGTIRGVAAVYNRFAYGEERGQALSAWGHHLTRLLHPPAGSNVVMLPRPA